MKIADAVYCVVDVEATGLDPKSDKIVEIACVATTMTEVLGMFSTLVNPGVPIPPEVSAVHGIADTDVFGAPGQFDALNALAAFVSRFDGAAEPVYCAHNLDFDGSFLRLAGGLCTKRLAMRLWPDYPAHKNQTLRFRRQLQVETYGIAPHRALGDALVTAALLRDELSCREFHDLGVDDVGALIQLVEQPMLLKTFPFGKFKGQPIEAAEPSYVRWMLTLPDLSRDLRFTLEHRLRAA